MSWSAGVGTWRLPLEGVNSIVVGIPQLGPSLSGGPTYPGRQVVSVDPTRLLNPVSDPHGRRKDSTPAVEVLTGTILDPFFVLVP